MMETSAAVSAPVIRLMLGETEYALRFDFNQMRQSELFWQYAARGVLSYLGIVDQLIHRTYLGLSAVAYGAAASAQMDAGQRVMSMREFDRAVSYDMLRPHAQALVQAVLESMPKGDGKKKSGAPGVTEETPWTALYQRAIRAGIGDAAFWRLSPAALIGITSGAQTRRRGMPGRRTGGTQTPAQRGGLTDCP